MISGPKVECADQAAFAVTWSVTRRLLQALHPLIPETLDVHDPGGSVNNLFDKLDLPKGHYYLHLAVLAGLPSYVDRRPGLGAWAIACADSGMGRDICLR